MAFTGTLNTNEIFGALYNMIISQEVLGDNIASTTSSLVDKARVDGTLYGDHRDLHTQPHSFPTRRSSDLFVRRPCLSRSPESVGPQE